MRVFRPALAQIALAAGTLASGSLASGALGGCRPAADSARPARDDTSTDTGVVPVFTLSGPDSVALPYASTGAAAPSFTFTLQANGKSDSDAGLAVTVDGPFTLTLQDSPLAVDEGRTGTITYSGDMATPALTTGSLTITVDQATLTIGLAAVIGDADIGPATWDTDEWGACTTLDLPSAPFPHSGRSYTDSSVRICVPTGLSDRGNIGVITHFHGWNATIDEVDADQELHAQASLSGRDAIFILPQGPVEAEDGDFGRLDEANGLADLVRDAISVLYRDGVVMQPVIGLVVLSSHSGGYGAVANVIQHGGLPISAVHLYDSMYGDEDTFAEFAQSGGVLRSSYTSGGGTDDVNRETASRLSAAGLSVGASFFEDTLRASPVTIGFIDSSHGDCLADDQSYARWLAASGLPRIPTAPPELLAIVGGRAEARWRADGDLTVQVEGSTDAERWTVLETATGTSASVPAYPFLRLMTEAPDAADTPDAADARPSRVYGASDTGAEVWLIVDGFDRIFGGSWRQPTHDFAALLGNSLNASWRAASNEAVAEGVVQLSSYTRVLWLLGDESTADRTFDAREKSAIDGYLLGGGKLVVSGSEVGYATAGSWLSSSLHASYVSDDAGSNVVEDWTLGVTYPEDFPDVLAGSEVIWRYGTGATAAVGWNQQVVVVGFALETLGAADRADALAELGRWLDG